MGVKKCEKRLLISIIPRRRGSRPQQRGVDNPHGSKIEVGEMGFGGVVPSEASFVLSPLMISE